MSKRKLKKEAIRQVEAMEREFELKPPVRLDGETDDNYLIRRASAVQTHFEHEKADLLDLARTLGMTGADFNAR